jgi:cyclopropane fatty-acyl-phospholipid synthase-like methyltransferase
MNEWQSVKSKALYDGHARKVGAVDLHLQVWRSVNGKPIGDDQINLIVAAIDAGLNLQTDNCLLELACGNGALSQYFLNRCKSYVGVDISECLIHVARDRFGKMLSVRFEHNDVNNFIKMEDRPEFFTRVLCYAAFQYFPDSMVIELLETLKIRFVNVTRVFVGNLPDLDRAARFFRGDVPDLATLRSHETPIGIWRSQEDIRKLCAIAGWQSTFYRMPDEFYASAYRFDAVLTRFKEQLA